MPYRTAGRRSPRPTGPDEAAAREARRRRATEELFDVRLAARAPVLELDVRNPIHRTRYRVFFPEYPGRDGGLCTCTDFARRGLGTCKHLETAWNWMADQGDLAATPSEDPSAPEGPAEGAARLAEADRRRGAWGPDGPRTIRDVERVGAVLFDDPATFGTIEGSAEEVGPGAGRRARPRRSSRARP